MPKIMINEEQNKAIEMYKQQGNTLRQFVKFSHVWDSPFSPLKGFTVDDMARIIYEPGSYEVQQPKYEVGEKVMVKWINKKKEQLFEIKEVTDEVIRIKSERYGHNFGPAEIMRHLTKEEAFWAELGREKNEF